MKVQFAHKWLCALYETGQIPTKKRFFKGMDERFFEVMQCIESAHTIQDLFSHSSLHFERLSGRRCHQHSLRLNKKYRLIVELDNYQSPTTFTIVNIEDYHR